MRPLVISLLVLGSAALLPFPSPVHSRGSEDQLRSAVYALRDAPQPPAKLASGLYRPRPGAAARQETPVPQSAAASPTVQVEVEAAAGREEAALAAVAAARGVIQAMQGRLIQALVPPEALEALAAEPSVLAVRKPLRARPQAIVVSEGTSLLGASSWQQAGLSGRGAKVGIIDSFEGYSSLVGTELPGDVVFRDFTTPASPDPCESPLARRHGTAVAEIVADTAPAARLYLAQANTSVEFARAVDWLLQQGVHVINFSAVFPGGRPYGLVGSATDFFADTVDRAAQAGVLWANAAGNSADSHWTGNWSDRDRDRLLDFAPRDPFNDLVLSGTAASCLLLVLLWDDAWGGACQDYSLLVGYFDPAGSPQVVGSDDRQDCSAGALPREAVEITSLDTADGRLYIAIGQRAGAQPRRLHLFVFGLGDLQYVVPSRSVLPPADRPTALAVGAVPASAPDTVEFFSSQGPTWDGRIKPDLVAPDRVSTVTYGAGRFAGTSASAPHVAGATALVKQANPGWSGAQLRQFLESRAVDLGAPGKDNAYGVGRLQLGPPPPGQPPPTAPPVPPAIPSIHPFDNGRARATWLPPEQVSRYRLCASLDFEFTFGLTCQDVPAAEAPGVLLVGVPWWDTGIVYYRLEACNDLGCSAPVRLGGVGRRAWPSENDWNFYVTAIDVFGQARVAAWNASPVAGKVSDLALWTGIAGFGGQAMHACPAVMPGQGCGPLDLDTGSDFVSATQGFPPFGAIGIALRVR